MKDESKHVFEPHDDDDNDSNFCRLCNKYRLDERYHVAAQGDVVDREHVTAILKCREHNDGLREQRDKIERMSEQLKMIHDFLSTGTSSARVVDRAAVLEEAAQILDAEVAYREGSIKVAVCDQKNIYARAARLIRARISTPPAAKEDETDA